MPKAKSNFLHVSVNGKKTVCLGLRRSGNGSVILGLRSKDRKPPKGVTSHLQSLYVGCLEVDKKGTHFFYRYIESMSLKVGDVVTIQVQRTGAISRERTVKKESKKLREARKKKAAERYYASLSGKGHQRP